MVETQGDISITDLDGVLGECHCNPSRPVEKSKVLEEWWQPSFIIREVQRWEVLFPPVERTRRLYKLKHIVVKFAIVTKWRICNFWCVCCTHMYRMWLIFKFLNLLSVKKVKEVFCLQVMQKVTFCPYTWKLFRAHTTHKSHLLGGAIVSGWWQWGGCHCISWWWDSVFGFAFNPFSNQSMTFAELPACSIESGLGETWYNWVQCMLDELVWIGISDTDSLNCKFCLVGWSHDYSWSGKRTLLIESWSKRISFHIELGSQWQRTQTILMSFDMLKWSFNFVPLMSSIELLH